MRSALFLATEFTRKKAILIIHYTEDYQVEDLNLRYDQKNNFLFKMETDFNNRANLYSFFLLSFKEAGQINFILLYY